MSFSSGCILQGSVATLLRFGRKFLYTFCWKFHPVPAAVNFEIVWDLAKLLIKFNTMFWDSVHSKRSRSYAVHSVSPELVLNPPHHLTSIDYNLKDEFVLGSGMQNGQLAFFDTRSGNTPVELSSMWTSHKDPVSRMIWIVSKTGQECMSAATDGQVSKVK